MEEKALSCPGLLQCASALGIFTWVWEESLQEPGSLNTMTQSSSAQSRLNGLEKVQHATCVEPFFREAFVPF